MCSHTKNSAETTKLVCNQPRPHRLFFLENKSERKETSSSRLSTSIKKQEKARRTRLVRNSGGKNVL